MAAASLYQWSMHSTISMASTLSVHLLAVVQGLSNAVASTYAAQVLIPWYNFAAILMQPDHFFSFCHWKRACWTQHGNFFWQSPTSEDFTRLLIAMKANLWAFITIRSRTVESHGRRKENWVGLAIEVTTVEPVLTVTCIEKPPVYKDHLKIPQISGLYTTPPV